MNLETVADLAVESESVEALSEVAEETPKTTSRKTSRSCTPPKPVVVVEAVEAAPGPVVEPKVVEETNFKEPKAISEPVKSKRQN